MRAHALAACAARSRPAAGGRGRRAAARRRARHGARCRRRAGHTDTVRADFLGWLRPAPTVTRRISTGCAPTACVWVNAASAGADHAAGACVAADRALRRRIKACATTRRSRRRKASPRPRTTSERGAAATAAVVASFQLDRRFGPRVVLSTTTTRVVGQAVRGGYTPRNDATPTRSPTPRSPGSLSVIAQPVFLWRIYYDAHAPYAPSAAVASARWPATCARNTPPRSRRSTRDQGLFADGKLAPERTLVVVAADHGEPSADHGERTHGLLLRTTRRRVPLILRLPATRAGGGTAVGRVWPDSSTQRGSACCDSLGLTAPKGDGIELAAPPGAGRRTASIEEASLPCLNRASAPLYAWLAAPPSVFDRGAGAGVLRPSPPTRPNSTNRLRQARRRPLRGRLRARPSTRSAWTRASDTRPPRRRWAGSADPTVTARLRSLGYLGGGGPAAPRPIWAGSGKSPSTRLVDLQFERAVILLDSGKPQAAFLALLGRGEGAVAAQRSCAAARLRAPS